MKRLILILMVLMCFSLAATDKKTLKIDNFEDGDITESPSWWTFDNSTQEVINSVVFSNSALHKYLGKNCLQIKGETKDYYIGGMGLYVGADASNFTHLKVYVYGSGPKSGKITFQLYDDDNNNYQLEQDIENNYEPIFDDKFEYTVNVIWKGWQVLIIPIEKFKDTNKTVGDNIWNPNSENGSGGLLHFQMIFLANAKTGPINVALDNIKLIKLKR